MKRYIWEDAFPNRTEESVVSQVFWFEHTPTTLVEIQIVAVSVLNNRCVMDIFWKGPCGTWNSLCWSRSRSQILSFQYSIRSLRQFIIWCLVIRLVRSCLWSLSSSTLLMAQKTRRSISARWWRDVLVQVIDSLSSSFVHVTSWFYPRASRSNPFRVALLHSNIMLKRTLCFLVSDRSESIARLPILRDHILTDSSSPACYISCPLTLSCYCFLVVVVRSFITCNRTDKS